MITLSGCPLFGAMSYVVTAQKPTSVSNAITGNFTSSDEVNLIICKSTRIEIHTLTPNGLLPFLDIGIYGRVASMYLFRPKNEMKDLLFLHTEEQKFCVLAYDDESGEIVTRANGNLQSRSGKPAEHAQRAIIDPENRAFALHLYTGILYIVQMDPNTGKLAEAYQIRIEQTQVLDIAFLHGCEVPTVSILYQGTDENETRYISTYELSLDEKELKENTWNQKKVESAASILVAVPKPHCGLLCIGETSITYVNGTKEEIVSMEASSISAIGRIENDGSRYLVGDIFGIIRVLYIKHEGNETSLSLEKLGKSSTPSTLTYLDKGVVFVGSLRGDSQLVRLQTTPNEDGSYLEQLESFINLGPIVDFVVVDLERQGQGQIVTCSGAFNDGSLRIIRNGVGINEQAAVELPGVKGLWSLHENGFDKYLVVSFVGQTRILAISDEEMGEVLHCSGLDGRCQTLYCGNITNHRIVQVTEREVRIFASTGEFTLLDSWKVPESDASITIATANTSQLLLSLGGGSLLYMDLQDDIKPTKTTKMKHEIACLDIHPLGTESRATVCSVGLWTDISIHVLELPSLIPLQSEILGGEFLPRSILFVTLEKCDYLLCTLGDGHLFSFRYAQDTHSLHDKKKVSLGTKPILLSTFMANESMNVFAASDRPTVIYSHNKKLLYSNVNLSEADYVCPFNAEAFPDSLAIIGEDNLIIGTIDEIQKLHIRTVPLGEMPRRILHHEDSNCFIVVTVRFTDGAEEGFVRVFDDQSFELTSSFALGANESGFSMLVFSPPDYDETFIVVGTTIPQLGDIQVNKGRILLFTVNEEKKITLHSERSAKGGVFSLAHVEGKVVAGISGDVVLHEFTDNMLQDVATHSGNILSLHLASRGNLCAVGDLMRSVSLLEVNKGTTNSLAEIARDYHPNWIVALEMLTDQVLMCAENFYNFLVVQQDHGSGVEEVRSRLETVGRIHIGEAVNRFRHGSLVMKSHERKPIPTTLFGTVSGAIGIVASLETEEFLFFEKVQHQINQVIKGVGGFDHAEWRAFKNDREVRSAKGFIDGDLVESYLDLPKEKQFEVSSALEVTTAELIKRIEDISQALH